MKYSKAVHWRVRKKALCTLRFDYIKRHIITCGGHDTVKHVENETTKLDIARRRTKPVQSTTKIKVNVKAETYATFRLEGGKRKESCEAHRI